MYPCTLALKDAFPFLTPLAGSLNHGPLMPTLGSSGFQPPAFPPRAQLLPPSAAQESRGDVWIPEGMFSTFLETHCGLVCCGKGLGRGSAQWNGWWLGGARMEETFIERPLCTRPQGVTDA